MNSRWPLPRSGSLIRRTEKPPRNAQIFWPRFRDHAEQPGSDTAAAGHSQHHSLLLVIVSS